MSKDPRSAKHGLSSYLLTVHWIDPRPDCSPPPVGVTDQPHLARSQPQRQDADSRRGTELSLPTTHTVSR